MSAVLVAYHDSYRSTENAGLRDALRDQVTLGRSLYYSGGTLDQCYTPAMRSGFCGAEADCRRADLAAMLEVSFDEWKLHRDEYDSVNW